ncbi:MAG: hypothetical protein AT714_07930 [Vulcanisaeta sp. OSP_8]|jgi:hypothetical protein|nr:MAG: hypothetical protein AT714_07930 [Vulcanisaeta sp. OSP_8]
MQLFVDIEPIILIGDARRGLQNLTELINKYERTKDSETLNEALKLGLSIIDKALTALLMARGIRIKDWGYVSQVLNYIVPSNTIDPGLRDSIAKCLSQSPCDYDSAINKIGDLNRLVDYAHSVVTHRVLYHGP